MNIQVRVIKTPQEHEAAISRLSALMEKISSPTRMKKQSLNY